MKKLLPMLLVLALLLAAGCTPATENPPQTTGTATQTATPVPEKIDASEVDVLTEQWIVTERSFTSETEYKAETVLLDVEFKNRKTGTTLLIPGFWDGDNTFRVRFAPTECGIWDYTTKCDGDTSINGLTGTVGANPYTGDLEIYKRGFVKTVSGTKHFMYNDGTPFFYLGDTHWTMLKEEFDTLGKSGEGKVEGTSHFKYIVDKRVEQGFTVYQSEPIGITATLNDGVVNKNDIKGLQKADQYFQYIAEKGLVHANAQFFYTTTMTDKLINNTALLKDISHHWVARFGAYPVLWTLAQEIDNDNFAESNKSSAFTYQNNPWVKVAEYIHQFDAYQHPLTGHQEHTHYTTVTGKGTNADVKVGISAFFSSQVTQATGHSWYAAQWKPKDLTINAQIGDDVPKDYWNSPKVGVNYEGAYEQLATKNFGARAQAWITYLSGFRGYGYGVQDIWYYNSTYEADTTANDGVDKITPKDKRMKWPASIELPSAYQLGYLRSFFESFDWWNLVPDFNDQKVFKPLNAKDVFYVCSAKGDEIVVVYFYSFTKAPEVIKF